MLSKNLISKKIFSKIFFYKKMWKLIVFRTMTYIYCTISLALLKKRVKTNCFSERGLILKKFQHYWICLILSFRLLKFENNWLENKVALLKNPKNLKFSYLGSGWRYWPEIFYLVLYPNSAPLCELSSKIRKEICRAPIWVRAISIM